MARQKFNSDGINEYIQILQHLTDDWKEIAGKAIYEGTKIIADRVKANINALPIDEHWGTPDNPLNGVTRVQKQGLLDSFGISDMQDDGGFLNTLIGFDNPGYNADGQPNLLVARATQSGTTFSKKIPFFKRAVDATRGAAEQKMKEILEEEINKLTR